MKKWEEVRVDYEKGEAFIFNCSDCLIRPNESTHEKCVLCHINVTRRWCLIGVHYVHLLLVRRNIVRRSSTRHPESYKSIKLNAETTNHISCWAVHGEERITSSRSWNRRNGKLMGTCLIKSLVWCTTFSSSHHHPPFLLLMLPTTAAGDEEEISLLKATHDSDPDDIMMNGHVPGSQQLQIVSPIVSRN